jgi:signal transduction histidine kinase
MAEFQMADLANQVLLELQPLALSKNQDLSLELEEKLPPVFGDKHALHRVLTNLVANAIEYTAAGGKIIIRGTTSKNTVVISVVDTGRGIPKRDLPQLFERFAQGTSRHRTTGTGLGLYLSRQIIEAHGGRIWANSVEGKGSTFSFELLPSASFRDSLPFVDQGVLEK